MEIQSGETSIRLVFHDVDGFMRRKDFRLFDLRTSRNYLSGRGQLQDYFRRYFNLGVGRMDYRAKLYAGDALYVRDWRKHDMTKNNRWLKLLVSLLLYKYYDFPVYFSELARQEVVLDSSQQERLRAEIISVAPRPLPHLRADLIGRLARRALRLFGYDGCYQAFWLKRSIPNQ